MDYKLGELLSKLDGKNIRIYAVLIEDFKTLAYAFFDQVTLSGQDANGNPMTRNTIAPRGLNGIEHTLTVDGEAIEWYDYAMIRYKTTITADATLTPTSGLVTITVTDMPEVAQGDKIYLTATKPATGPMTQTEIDGIVESLDTTAKTITFKPQFVDQKIYDGTSTIDVKAGQNVSRGAWLRNDNDEITRVQAKSGYDKFVSYMQHFSERMRVEKKELNVVYQNEKDVKDYANKKLAASIHTIISGLAESIYKSRNVPSGAGDLDKLELLGWEEICRVAGTIVDLGTSTNVERDLRTEIKKAIVGTSKLGGTTVSLLCNSEFLDQLSELDQDKIRYDKEVNRVSTVFPKYNTPHGEVELLRDPMLDNLYGYSMCFTAPLKFVKLWVRENQEFNPTGGVTRADQSIQFFEVITNLREQKLYDLTFECGLLPGGMMTGAYRMIKNFYVA